MTRPKRPTRVREQLQIYLDAPDKALLEALVRATGLPRTELFRRGLRSLAQDTLGEKAPGWSLDRLVGALGDGPDLPADLAARHDEYLYAPHTRRGEPRPR
ncbi:MAG: ribbon-helix-helix domain-containing protein [Gemmatimonadota bacterium]